MPTLPENCPNYAINIQMCPCPSEQCPNRGICCECIQAHAAKGGLTNCMQGTKRDPATVTLVVQAVSSCANQARNLEFCICSYDPCNNKGMCCSCVRNHFTVDGAGRTACMRGA